MKNLKILKTLISEYFKMQQGELISNHLEQIFLFEYKNKKVSIKRKVLKHFVESRKKELIVNYSEEESINLLNLVISKVQDIFENFDSADIGDLNRKIFSKDYSHEGLPNLRVVHEENPNEVELVSIHFRKHKKN